MWIFIPLKQNPPIKHRFQAGFLPVHHPGPVRAVGMILAQLGAAQEVVRGVGDAAVEVFLEEVHVLEGDDEVRGGEEEAEAVGGRGVVHGWRASVQHLGKKIKMGAGIFKGWVNVLKGKKERERESE